MSAPVPKIDGRPFQAMGFIRESGVAPYGRLPDLPQLARREYFVERSHGIHPGPHHLGAGCSPAVDRIYPVFDARRVKDPGAGVQARVVGERALAEG
uniref:Uncharacterized protein n=1 Tax=Candidatus Kentrum sp. LPFa TaxID=2126335 RepID=A0A450WQ50_9GAMM|nr:MAG: hypothetical protein BECKLPF1236B_GA0070989_11616 [Candidatus Kentron sp. LPFa]